MSKARSAAAIFAVLASGCGDSIEYLSDDPWVETVSFPSPDEPRVLVTNSGDDTLSVLDGETLEPVYRGPTGRIPAEREGPHHAAASADGRFFFVGISNFVPGSGSGPHGSHGNGTVDGYLLRYDGETGRLIDELRVDRSPGDVRITPDGRYVLQSHFDLQSLIEAQIDGEDPNLILSRLAVIDAETMERVAMIPTCPAAHGILPSADSSKVYVACWGSDELAVVSLDPPVGDNAPVSRYPVVDGASYPPTFGPYAIAISPTNGEVWVSNLEGRTLMVFDPETEAFDPNRTTPLPGSPYFGAFSADGAFLYLPIQAVDALLKVDTSDGSFETYGFPEGSCSAPHGALLLDDDTMGVVCEGNKSDPGTVVRLRVGLEPGVAAHEADFEVGVFPDDVILLPELSQ